MSNIFSDFFKGGVGSITDASLRDKMLVEMDFMDRRMERLEKENAESGLQIKALKKEIAELEAKIPPSNMTDIGPCFIIKLLDDSISKYPHCPKCRTVMDVVRFGHYQCHCGLTVNRLAFEEAFDAYNRALAAPG